MKKIVFLTLCCLLLSCYATVTHAAKSLLPEVLGETYYTRVNLWNSKIISSWCFHKGWVLALGTKVEILRVRKKEIKFKTEDGEILSIRKSRHTRAKMPELFELYFSKENVKAADGDYYKLSDFDRESVDKGIIAIRMSKEAVVMAYGYPPGRDGSAPLTSNMWTYWGPHRLETQIKAHFYKNVIYKIDRFAETYDSFEKIKVSTEKSSNYVILKEDRKESQSKLSLSEEIEKISELHSSGKLTDEEFKKAKEKLLSE